MKNKFNKEKRMRGDVTKHSPAEKAIHEAICEIEKLPADTRLSESIGLLIQAQDIVYDYLTKE